jgi:hypothetical protein
VQHGQVVGGEAADEPAGYCLPSARVIWKLSAPSTTWALVTTLPSASKTMPEPSP